MGTAGRQGWVAGARVMDARGLEHATRPMQHGCVQCSRLGCAEVCNYRCKELQLLAEASGDEESQSLASELGQEDFLDRDGSGRAIDLVEREMAEEGLDQDRLDGP